MILNRIGGKQKIASEIIKHFPPHDIYMEPFFGAGGMFFNKPKAKYNFLADLDADVYNLFRQLLDNRDEFLHALEITPITEMQFREWGKGKREATDVMNAVRFIVISNFGLYGKPDTLRVCPTKPKKVILDAIDETLKYLADVYFLNCDFRDFFRKVDYNGRQHKCFCYADPPYLETSDNYSSSFTEKDSFELFEELERVGVKFAMSEFDHPFILEQARQRNLNVIYIGERANLMNVRTEIIVTNYETQQLTLFS